MYLVHPVQIVLASSILVLGSVAATSNVRKLRGAPRDIVRGLALETQSQWPPN